MAVEDCGRAPALIPAHVRWEVVVWEALREEGAGHVSGRQPHGRSITCRDQLSDVQQAREDGPAAAVRLQVSSPGPPY